MMRTQVAVIAILTVSLAGTVTYSQQYENDCQGGDLERSRQIVEFAWRSSIQLSIEMATTGDFAGGMQRMFDLVQRMNYAASQLPQACQLLIAQWANAIGGAYGGGGGGGSGGTQCMGSVCCDQTGCY